MEHVLAKINKAYQTIDKRNKRGTLAFVEICPHLPSQGLSPYSLLWPHPGCSVSLAIRPFTFDILKSPASSQPSFPSFQLFFSFLAFHLRDFQSTQTNMVSYTLISEFPHSTYLHGVFPHSWGLLGVSSRFAVQQGVFLWCQPYHFLNSFLVYMFVDRMAAQHQTILDPLLWTPHGAAVLCVPDFAPYPSILPLSHRPGELIDIDQMDRPSWQWHRTNKWVCENKTGAVLS